MRGRNREFAAEIVRTTRGFNFGMFNGAWMPKRKSSRGETATAGAVFSAILCLCVKLSEVTSMQCLLWW